MVMEFLKYFAASSMDADPIPGWQRALGEVRSTADQRDDSIHLGCFEIALEVGIVLSSTRRALATSMATIIRWQTQAARGMHLSCEICWLMDGWDLVM